MRFRYKVLFIVGGCVVLIDQATKLAVQNALPWEGITVIPGFLNLVYVLNRGAAFGFLNRADITWQTYFFIAASVLAVLLIFHLVRSVTRRDPLLFTGLALILGGAIGNLIDRIRMGMVIDFLDFHLRDHHWPAFNVADIALSLGAAAIAVAYFRSRTHGSSSG